MMAGMLDLRQKMAVVGSEVVKPGGDTGSWRVLPARGGALISRPSRGAGPGTTEVFTP
jgi:hypothetical protein